MADRTAYAGTAQAGDVYSAANHARMPGGWIGYALRTSAQSSITTEVDLTGLSVTVDVNEDRLLRVAGFVNITSAGAGGAEVHIKEGSTYLQTAAAFSGGAAAWPMAPEVLVLASAGEHTYKLTGVASGTTIGTFATATAPAMITVEDLGPAS